MSSFAQMCACDDHHHFLDLAPTKEIFMDRFRARLSGENGAFVGSLFQDSLKGYYAKNVIYELRE